MKKRPDCKFSFRAARYGVIIGIVDHNDAVESVFVSLDEIDSWMHGDLFDFRGVFHRWRWDHKNGIESFEEACGGERMDCETRYRIKSHLEREYGIKYADGRFDWKHFKEMEDLEPDEDDD